MKFYCCDASQNPTRINHSIRSNSNNSFSWPQINKDILIADKIKFIIQINGKTRGIFEVKKGLSEEEILEKIKENPKINKYINDKSIKNKIFIPNKLINIIV